MLELGESGGGAQARRPSAAAIAEPAERLRRRINCKVGSAQHARSRAAAVIFSCDSKSCPVIQASKPIRPHILPSHFSSPNPTQTPECTPYSGPRYILDFPFFPFDTLSPESWPATPPWRTSRSRSTAPCRRVRLCPSSRSRRARSAGIAAARQYTTRAMLEHSILARTNED